MTKKEFFDRDPSCYFVGDGKAAAAYCRQYCKEETAHIIEVAEQVCHRVFLFDLKWDMERTYEPVSFQEEMDWKYMPFNDPEFVWQMNRHRYFICLGQAYQMTGDEKYVKTFVELLTDWVRRVPLIDENKQGPWRTLEAGLRGENWNKALYLMKDSPWITDEFIELFYGSMMEHARYLSDSHSYHKELSNWGVLEDHGLFEIALMLPQSEELKKYAEIAVKNLDREAGTQVMGDGVQWEQSPMYHNEVLHCFLDVMILAERNQIVLPERIKETARKMLYAEVAWKKPDGCQTMMGDSDDTDIRDMLTTGACLFQDGVMKFAGLSRLDFENIWDLGMDGVSRYEKIKAQKPGFTSVMLEDSGNCYLRTGWGEKDHFLHFQCGTIGGGHGHSDKLHVDLSFYGEDVLVDSGRYTYVAGGDRYSFKDPTAHNTITVDDRFFTECKNSWEYHKLSRPVKPRMKILNGGEFVEGGHTGYMDQGEGVFVNRRIIHIKPDIFILDDEMFTSGSHTYRQYFHFNNRGQVESLGNRTLYQGRKAGAMVFFPTKGLSVAQRPGKISRHYNLKEDNQYVETYLKGNGFTSMLTVLWGFEGKTPPEAEVRKLAVRPANSREEYPASIAEALQITIGKDREYVVIICHKEINPPTNLLEAGGCMGFGNIIVFDKKKENRVGEVFQW